MSFYDGQKVIVVGHLPEGRVVHGTIQNNNNDIYPWYFSSDDGRLFLSFTAEGWECQDDEGNYDTIHMIPHQTSTSLEKFFEL